jgi:hypothetical protein
LDRGVTVRRSCRRCSQPGHFSHRCPNGEATRICELCRKAPATHLKYKCGPCDVKRGDRRGYKVAHHCNYCSKVGHNIKTCPDRLAAGEDANPLESSEMV